MKEFRSKVRGGVLLRTPIAVQSAYTTRRPHGASHQQPEGADRGLEVASQPAEVLRERWRDADLYRIRCRWLPDVRTVQQGAQPLAQDPRVEAIGARPPVLECILECAPQLGLRQGRQ